MVVARYCHVLHAPAERFLYKGEAAMTFAKLTVSLSLLVTSCKTCFKPPVEIDIIVSISLRCRRGVPSARACPGDTSYFQPWSAWQKKPHRPETAHALLN